MEPTAAEAIEHADLRVDVPNHLVQRAREHGGHASDSG
jgi:hypothetical protein